MKELVKQAKKRGDLEARIMNLGMDNNLVKNMAELFHKWYKIVLCNNMRNYSYLKPSTRSHNSIVHEHTPGSRTIFGVHPSTYSTE